MSRLPTISGDDNAWGSILNDFLLQSHNSDGSLKPASVTAAGTEMIANKGVAGGYPGLDDKSNLNIVGQILRVGSVDYSYAGILQNGGMNSAYVIVDKANTASDASVVFRDQGNSRAEIGISTNDDIHFKTVTGTDPSNTFTDRLIIFGSNSTSGTPGDVEVTSSLGIGTATPQQLLHVAGNNTTGRLGIKLENDGVAAGSNAIQFASSSNNWVVGNDGGINGNNNFFLQDGATGSFVLFVNANDQVGIGNNTNPAYALDVKGDIASTSAGNGLRVKEGTNAKMGTATLVAGTVTVATTSVTANSRIFLTVQAPGGTVGASYVSTRTAGVSFVITSTSATDTSVVAWMMVEPS